LEFEVEVDQLAERVAAQHGQFEEFAVSVERRIGGSEYGSVGQHLKLDSDKALALNRAGDIRQQSSLVNPLIVQLRLHFLGQPDELAEDCGQPVVQQQAAHRGKAAALRLPFDPHARDPAYDLQVVIAERRRQPGRPHSHLVAEADGREVFAIRALARGVKFHSLRQRHLIGRNRRAHHAHHVYAGQA